MHFTARKQAAPIKQRCHRCRSTGRLPCAICGGAGRVMTGTDRTGTPQYTKCAACFGLKTSRCTACGGEGFRL